MGWQTSLSVEASASYGGRSKQQKVSLSMNLTYGKSSPLK